MGFNAAICFRAILFCLHVFGEVIHVTASAYSSRPPMILVADA